MVTVGMFIKFARERKNITQLSLAKSVGVSRTAISAWENDEWHPGVVHLWTLFAILDISSEEINQIQMENPDDSDLASENCEIDLRKLNLKGLAQLYKCYFRLLQDEGNLQEP